MRWTQQRRREVCSQGGLAVSEQQRADERRFRLRETSAGFYLSPAKPVGEDGCCVRQNRVVLASVADAKPCGGASAQPGIDKSSIREVTVAKGIRRRGERGISRKAIAQGMPECSGCTCMLVCAFLRKHCTRDRGCSKHPAFPAPSVLRDKGSCKPRAQIAPREGEVIFSRHHPRMRVIQYSRDVSD